MSASVIVISGTRRELDSETKIFATKRMMAACPTTAYRLRVGDCPTGIDSLARTLFADATVFQADWYHRGSKAGPMRNARMLDGATHLLAFPAPDSRGTINCIKQALKLGIEIHVYPVLR